MILIIVRFAIWSGLKNKKPGPERNYNLFEKNRTYRLGRRSDKIVKLRFVQFNLRFRPNSVQPYTQIQKK